MVSESKPELVAQEQLLSRCASANDNKRTAIAKMTVFDIFEVLRSVLFLTQYVEAQLTLWIP